MLLIGLPNVFGLNLECKHILPVYGLVLSTTIESSCWIILGSIAINMTPYIFTHVTLSLMTIGVSIIVGVIVALMNRSSHRIRVAMMYSFGSLVPVYLLITSIPMLMFTVIYPLETIPVLSFGTAIIAGTIITNRVKRWYSHINSLYNKPRKIKQCNYQLGFFYYYYGLVPTVFIVLLVLYQGTLNILSESPTNNFFALLLAFVPSVLTTTFGFMLSKKLGQVKKPNTSTKLNESGTE